MDRTPIVVQIFNLFNSIHATSLVLQIKIVQEYFFHLCSHEMRPFHKNLYFATELRSEGTHFPHFFKNNFFRRNQKAIMSL